MRIQATHRRALSAPVRPAAFVRPLVLALAAALTLAALCPAGARAKGEPDEVQLGKEAAAELEKQYKVVQDEALQKRIDAIGQTLAAIANEVEVPATYGSSKITKFDYIFKVLDDKDVNALSMPGGFIYINKGLVDYAQSDDELAGVIAHEIAHVAHHHMIALIKEQAKENNKLAVALLLTILSGAPAADVGNVMMAARFIQIAKLNGYSREAEKDSDATGLAYLSKSKYNPVGMLTFMERLARDELGRPEINWGVYQTHPYPGERSAILAALLEGKGIPINRRAVTRAAAAEVRKNEKNEQISEVTLGGKPFFAPAAGDVPSEARAKAVAERLNALLDDGLRLRELKRSGAAVIARGQPLLEVTEADAAMEGKKPEEVAAAAYDVLYKVLLDQELQRVY